MSLMRERAGSPSARLRTCVREKGGCMASHVCHGSSGSGGVLGGVLGGVVEMAQTEPQPPRPMQWYSSLDMWVLVWWEICIGRVSICSAKN